MLETTLFIPIKKLEKKNLKQMIYQNLQIYQLNEVKMNLFLMLKIKLIIIK